VSPREKRSKEITDPQDQGALTEKMGLGVKEEVKIHEIIDPEEEVSFPVFIGAVELQEGSRESPVSLGSPALRGTEKRQLAFEEIAGIRTLTAFNPIDLRVEADAELPAAPLGENIQENPSSIAEIKASLKASGFQAAKPSLK